jgi:hypothetical protein
MALKPKEAYLHLVTGGFDNEKRREVRKLFAAPSEADSEEDDVTDEHDLDLAVGLLEEFYSMASRDLVCSRPRIRSKYSVLLFSTATMICGIC